MIVSNTAAATKWVELKPQEVMDRAEVIVTGKYDFTSKEKPSRFIFQGVDFHIKNVYKGDISEQIMTVGIDQNDVGWADEFQKDNGEFLLLLETSEDADFLVPVGGPNGMIKMNNGKVEESNEERIKFFEDYLASQPYKTIEVKAEKDFDSRNNSPYPVLYVSASVLVIMAVLLLLYRYKRKK